MSISQRTQGCVADIFFRGEPPLGAAYAEQVLGRIGRLCHVGVPAADAATLERERAIRREAPVVVFVLAPEDFEACEGVDGVISTIGAYKKGLDPEVSLIVFCSTEDHPGNSPASAAARQVVSRLREVAPLHGIAVFEHGQCLYDALRGWFRP